MTRWSHRALWLALGALLVGTAAPAQAGQTLTRFAPFINAADPAQLAAAAALFVKVDSKSGTDTILVVNRQQVDDVTTTGTSIAIHLRFYDASCNLKFDNNVTLTPQGIAVGLGSALFGIDEPGVVLADSYDATSAALAKAPQSVRPITTQFAISGLVIDGNFGAIYERQGSPFLFTAVLGNFAWAGFSDQDIDDWFIGGFTMLQMMCPQTPGDFAPGTLSFDMHDLAAFIDDFPTFRFANFFPVVNVYDAKEVLRRSIHEVPCFCNTDSAFFGKDSRGKGYPGDFVDVLVSMKAVGLGTFHWDDPSDTNGDPGKFIAWRVISDGKAVYWDARLRTTSPLACCES